MNVDGGVQTAFHRDETSLSLDPQQSYMDMQETKALVSHHFDLGSSLIAQKPHVQPCIRHHSELCHGASSVTPTSS